jgi:hypothetical protein
MECYVMESYHNFATCTVADSQSYVKIPTIELIRRELCAHGAGALVVTSVRKIARATGRSAGQLSDHLDTLEEHGWIRRLADHTGTVVEVLRSDHVHDRSFSALGCDHVHDRSAKSDHPVAMPNPARHAPTLGAKSDHADDPPHTPRNGTKHDLMQQQHARATDSPVCDQAGAPPAPLNAGEWARILAGTPGYTQTHFAQDVLRCESRPDLDNPIALIVRARSKGEPVYSGAELAQRAADVTSAEKRQEQQHERPAQRPASTGQRHAPNRTGRSGGKQPIAAAPPLTRAYLQSRGRRGDKLRDLSGGGPAAGG